MIAGHYRLVERIGSGGTGVVWRAVDERLERSVAIKQILTQPSLPEGEKEIVRQRAAREARNAARFQHPNAIVVFDIFEHDGDPCLVMEYLPSQSLAQVLSMQGTLPLAQVAHIGEQVASALLAAHRVGLVHRDIKPGNVLLGENGTVKITDFGISKAKGDVNLTATGLISGTAAYLAPEVARGADPTPAADVFALGATLFHALEGEPPYGTNPNPLALLYAAANGQLGEVRNAGPLTDLLLDLLSFNPEDRPAMSDVRDQLAEFADLGVDVEVGQGLVTHRSDRSGARRNNGVRTLDRRAAQADISTAEMMAAASMPSEPSLPPVRPPRPGGPNTRSHRVEPAEPERNRRPLLFVGGFVAGLVVVAGVLLATINSAGSNSGAAPQANPTSSAAKATTTAAAAALGKTPSQSKVSTDDAIPAIRGFFQALFTDDYPTAYATLTPAAQQVYGSSQGFVDYWNKNQLSDWNAPTVTSNSDGSVTVSVTTSANNGSSKVTQYRIVANGGGKLLFDNDTR
ncbi:serine/threonine-protein kinase [Nocardia stercoris]|uniref:non-specific serine/threonine protein kinase n=1 Tax=Nocardia stercoris TaxID=2483361 RepID=A0A3M2KZC6_9NOCA|nr:serine/threonine-protein kinase [Nocardia stercoris]RMI29800.1 serine/threonine protein kinase [Nocardia stercoris]